MRFVGWRKYHVASPKHLITQEVPRHNPTGSAPSPGSWTRFPQPTFWQYAPISEIASQGSVEVVAVKTSSPPSLLRQSHCQGPLALPRRKPKLFGMAGSIATVSNAAFGAQGPSKGHCLPGRGKEWDQSFILLHSSFCSAEADAFIDSPIPKSLQAKGRGQ